MDEKNFIQLVKQTSALRESEVEAIQEMQNRVISKMITTMHQESDRLEHHLIEMPLSVIIYQWVILRLKCHPWKILVPTSLALSVLLQSILSRYNLIQLLTH